MNNLIELCKSPIYIKKRIYSECSKLMEEFCRTNIGFESHGFRVVDFNYEINPEDGLGLDYSIERIDGDYIYEDLEEVSNNPELELFKREVEIKIKKIILNTYMKLKPLIEILNKNI